MAKDLREISFGLALGILWGGSLLLLGIASFITGMWSELIRLISLLYIGYAPSVLGSFVGGVWGFVDGFVGGVIFAWLYNKL